MEHSFIVALFIISLTLTTLNNGADSDESDSSFYSSEDSFLTLSDDVKDLIVSSESEMDYDQSSVNPSKKIQFRQGIMNIMQQSGGGSQSVGIYGMPGFGIPGFGTGVSIIYDSASYKTRLEQSCPVKSTETCPICSMEKSCPLPEKCSEGFLLIEDECFFFSHKKATWDDATKKCQQMGSSLATFNRDSTWNAIKRHLDRIVVGHTVYWWISGNDRKTEGRFVWETSGESINPKYWCRDQPDDYQGKEDCLHIKYGSDYCWNDQECGKEYSYICHKTL